MLNGQRIHSYLRPCTKVGHLQASLKLDEQDIHWLTDTDAVNEGIEMAGIANILFWQVCKDTTR